MPSLSILDYIANNKCTSFILILLQVPSVVKKYIFYCSVPGIGVWKLLLEIFEEVKF